MGLEIRKRKLSFHRDDDVYVLGNQIKKNLYGNLRCESSGNGEQNHLLVGGEILNVDLVRW